MNGAHLHLIVNHLPVLGMGFGTLLLAFGWWRRNREVQRTALGVLVLSGLTAGVAYLTGEGAEEAIEGTLRGIEPYLERHEEAGLVGLVLAGITGVVSLLALASGRRGRALASVLVVLALIVGSVASVTLAWVANLGGQIGHPEIRSAHMATQEDRRGGDDEH